MQTVTSAPFVGSHGQVGSNWARSSVAPSSQEEDLSGISLPSHLLPVPSPAMPPGPGLCSGLPAGSQRTAVHCPALWACPCYGLLPNPPLPFNLLLEKLFWLFEA